MSYHGVPTTIWAQNVATAAFGVSLCGAILWRKTHFCSAEALPWALLLTMPIAIGLTFLSEGLNGVHRWMFIGPIRLHVASIALPLFLLGLAAADARHARIGWSLALITSALLVVQPDASEAAAFLSALAAMIIARSGKKRLAGALGAFLAPLCVIIAWRFEDGLESVTHVEGIIQLAALVHPALAASGMAALAVVPAPFYYQASGRHKAMRAGALAVAVYFSAKILISAGTGRYPVMVLGYGASPILGYYLAYGVLQRLQDHARNQARH